MTLSIAIFLLLTSIFVAWSGGNLFIRGVHSVGTALRLSGVVAGLLIASISTSSPELFVGVSSALRGIPDVSLGDVLGSNIVNIALIFGIFLLLSARRPEANEIRLQDVLVATLAPFAVLIASLDGMLAQSDGVAFLLLFALWVRLLTRKRAPTSMPADPSGKPLHFVTGLAMLVVAGYTFTESAGVLADHFSFNLFVLSSIIVALGTSMPELATTIVAMRKKEGALAVGNLLGSNVFNCLGILGIVAVIHPFTVNPIVVATPVAFAILATLATLLPRMFSQRLIGAMLIALYALYLTISTTLLH